jgi:Tfp pilus assembly protein PilF
MPRAAAAAERALGLDSSLAGARATLGAVRFLYDWSWSRADTALRQALALDPNGTDAARWYARLLLARGRPDEALAQGRAALELDPVSPAARVEVGRQLLLAGFLPEAETALERAWQADSSSAEAARSFGLLAELRKDYPLAEARYRRGLVAAPDDPALLAALGRVEALAGRPDSARARLQRLDSLSAVRWVSPYHLATVAEALDDRRRAYAWLDAAVAERSGELAEAGLDPRLGRLRDNRRWDRVARAVGLPEREGGDYNPPTSTPPSRPGRP